VPASPYSLAIRLFIEVDAANCHIEITTIMQAQSAA
jgi:hypothetical protein